MSSSCSCFGFLRAAMLSIVAVFVLLSAPVSAQTQAAGATVRGLVTDPDTAIIPGATVLLTTPAGKTFSVQSGSDGTYRVSAPAGTYTMIVTMPGFANFIKSGLALSNGQNLTIDAKLVVGEQTQIVNVTSQAAQVSTDADSNASATVIKGKDLDALSDDPDELQSELSALAGPAAGPNGGQIYVDGFTGGQLPPKSSIREIRINQNPFSAEYDRLGFGRVEVFTKPGTDKLHGSLSVQGNDNVFNTSNPFLGATNSQSPYYQFFLLGSVTGPLTKTSSFSVNGSRRTIQSNVIVDPTGFYSAAPGSTTPCAPGTITGCTANSFPGTAVFQPQSRADITPRLDFALGAKNVLTVRYQYEQASTQNSGGGGNSLPSTFSNTSSDEQEIQISDTQTFSPKVVNETRFEYQRGTSHSNALSSAPTLSVTGSFTTGGAGTQSANTVNTHIEVQNYSSVALARQFIRFGGRLRTTSQDTTTITNPNGSFTYNNVLDPCSNPNASASAKTGCGNAAAATPCLAANANVSSYQCGLASQFRLTTTLRPTFHDRETDLGLYVENDWKVKPNLTFSYGLRFETENRISSHDLAPRLSIAYGIPRSGGKAPMTVLRGGFGMFYERFGLGDFLTVQQYQLGSPAQQQTTVTNPGFACQPTSIGACGSGVAGRTTAYQLGNGMRSAYTMQAAIGIDQQIGKIGTISINYLPSRGNHEYLTRVTPLPTAFLYQFQSTGVFREQQIFVNANVRMKSVSAFGYFSANFVNSNTVGAGFIPTSTDSRVDYGRSSFAQKALTVAGATWSAPYKISVSPFMIARSGTPYNITTGTDVNGDSIYNDRPAFANGVSGNCSDASTFTTPAAGTAYKEIPINYCSGPAIFTVNLRAARTFGFGPSLASKNADPSGQNGGQNGRRGGPPGQMGGGGPGGGGGDRGGRGGMGGFGGSSGKRYNVTFGIQAQNIFNAVPYAAPTATSALTSTQFGKLTQLVGRPFSTNNAIRVIVLQATFNF